MRRQTALPGAHQRRQQQQPLHARAIGGARSSVAGAASASKAASSSSNSPSGRIDRQDRRAAAEHVDEDAAQRARGAAGRHVDGDVGQRQRIAVETEIRDQAPDSSASASVGRNGAPGGIEKTRGRVRPLIALPASAARDRHFRLRDRVGRADSDPVPVHPHAEQPARGDRRVEIGG